MSDSQIARHVGVDQKTVTNWRQQLEASEEIPKMATRTVNRNGKTYTQNTSKIGKSRRKRKPTASATSSTDAARKDHPNSRKEAASASITPGRTTRSQRIDHLARQTLSFIEATKHLAHLVGWLGETAGEFDEAERLLSNVRDAIAAVSADIEQKAIAADPLNAFRLGIQEKKQ